MSDRDAVPPPLPGTGPGPHFSGHPPTPDHPRQPPYQQSPYQQAPYQQAQPTPYQQAQQAPYQQAPYQQRPAPDQPHPGSVPPAVNSPLPPVPPPQAPAPAAGTPGQAAPVQAPRTRSGGLVWRLPWLQVVFHLLLVVQLGLCWFATQRGFMYPNLAGGAAVTGLVTIVVTQLLAGKAPRFAWLGALAGAAGCFGVLGYHLIREGDTRFMIPLTALGAAGGVCLVILVMLLLGSKPAAGRNLVEDERR